MKIIPAEESDLANLEIIADTCVSGMSEIPHEEKAGLVELISENLREHIRKDDNSFLKAVIEGNIVGFILIKRHEKLSELFVLSEYRSRGIGSRLLVAALNSSLPKSHLGYIWVNAALNAVNFYRKHGFVYFDNDIESQAFVRKMKYSL